MAARRFAGRGFAGGGGRGLDLEDWSATDPEARLAASHAEWETQNQNFSDEYNGVHSVNSVDSGIPNTFNLGQMQAEGWSAPELSVTRHGQLTNGAYSLSADAMTPHQTGSLVAGKSQFFYQLNSNQLVLDASAYADQNGLWTLSDGAKAKVNFAVPIGIDAQTGLPTNTLNLYRTNSGFVHGSPGSPKP